MSSATWVPLRPGMATSRMAMSGCARTIRSTASSGLLLWATMSRPAAVSVRQECFGPGACDVDGEPSPFEECSTDCADEFFVVDHQGSASECGFNGKAVCWAGFGGWALGEQHGHGGSDARAAFDRNGSAAL